MPRLGAICSGGDVGDLAVASVEVGPVVLSCDGDFSSGTGMCTSDGRMGLLLTVYGVWGGRDDSGDSRGGTNVVFADAAGTRASTLSSHSDAIAMIARSGRVARIREARMNSPRIFTALSERLDTHK